MKFLFTKENLPITVIVALVVWSYISFVSVILS